MKITKEKLKQIIKEELALVTNEGSDEELEHDIENTKQISQAVVGAIMDQQLKMGLDFKDRNTMNLIFNALDSAGATMRGMHKGGSAMQESADSDFGSELQALIDRARSQGTPTYEIADLLEYHAEEIRENPDALERRAQMGRSSL
jgi:hypothetical protein